MWKPDGLWLAQMAIPSTNEVCFAKQNTKNAGDA